MSLSPVTGSVLKLDKLSFTPLYHQIEQALRQQLASGALVAGQAISERELSEQLGVSRMTMRQALQALRAEGLLYAERGRGTFVAEPKLEVHTRHLLGFSEDMRRRGLTPSSRVLAFARIAAKESFATPGGLPAAAELPAEYFEITRLRLADNVPMAVETCCLPVQLCPQLKRSEVERGSLYQLLEQAYGIKIGSADEALEAACATKHEAALLSMKPKAPVLVVQRNVFATDGSLIEMVRSVYRGDRYQAAIHLKRKR